MPYLKIKLREWILRSIIGIVDAIGNTAAVVVPMLFLDANHLTDIGLWKSLGVTVGLVTLKTIIVALKDFKQYVIEVEEK
jgi:hypothetical protein